MVLLQMASIATLEKNLSCPLLPEEPSSCHVFESLQFLLDLLAKAENFSRQDRRCKSSFLPQVVVVREGALKLLSKKNVLGLASRLSHASHPPLVLPSFS